MGFLRRRLVTAALTANAIRPLPGFRFGIPAFVAGWLSGELGMLQTHCSADLVAACAGLPYGLAEAVRLLQDVERAMRVVAGVVIALAVLGLATSGRAGEVGTWLASLVTG